MAAMDLVPAVATRALPKPALNGYFTEDFQYGAAHRMANGRLVREVTITGVYKRITIDFPPLTDAQKLIVDNAVSDMADGSTAEFTPPWGGSSITVVLGETLPSWEITTVRNGAEYRHMGKLYLEQYD